MSDVFPLMSDRYGASVVSALIADYGSDIGTSGQDSIPDRSSCVVRLLSAIAAGSVAPVTAEIMILSGNTWVGTGQTIPVRSATGLAVTTTGRRIARKCSRFGWVVVET